MFETDKEVLDWYERQPRALSKDYVNSIRWNDIKNYPLNPAFVPVLVYMRDIEYFTDMYYQELRRTPTGKDPIIRKFMDRWSIEELHHWHELAALYREIDAATLLVLIERAGAEHAFVEQAGDREDGIAHDFGFEALRNAAAEIFVERVEFFGSRV